MARVVIALGGNALGNTAKEQLERVQLSAETIADLVEAGEQVVVVHGNGPQVGMIHAGLVCAAEQGVCREEMPFPECGAMSQGYIGYHLQNGVGNALGRRGLSNPVVSVVTQVVVDKEDAAFQTPTKPIGGFFSKEQAQQLAREKGYTMVEDAGRGYRRVVPSPAPQDILEKDAIRTLCDTGCVVIAAGGGGIPVVAETDGYEGVPAVIDKDLAAAKLCEKIGAQRLVILTAVEKVMLNYNTPAQVSIDTMTADEALRYCEQGQFAAGSMLPKVKAAAVFAKSGGIAVIASLEQAAQAVALQAGTIVAEES